MVRWAMSYWKTRRNRKGKYLCAVGTPTCHMSQPPPLFAPSLFFSFCLFLLRVSLCFLKNVSLLNICLWTEGLRVSWCPADGQSVTECGGSGCVGRRRRVRGEESHERLSCCSDPRFRLHSGNMSRNIRTHLCVNIWEHNRELDWHITHLTFTCASLVVAIATVIITALKAGNNNLIIIIENLDKYFWHIDRDRKIRKHCQRHDGLKHIVLSDLIVCFCSVNISCWNIGFMIKKSHQYLEFLFCFLFLAVQDAWLPIVYLRG